MKKKRTPVSTALAPVKKALRRTGPPLADEVAVAAAVEAWAERTTNPLSRRRNELMHDKKRAVADLLAFSKKHPLAIRPKDCLAWRAAMEARGLKPNTVYARISRVSSFFEWLRADPVLGKFVKTNPALLARPKCPAPYQTESGKSLTDGQMNALLALVKRKADAGSVTAKRDYALLLLYFLSGLRRTEAISLIGKDVEFTETGGIIIKYKQKGGKYLGRELADPEIRMAIDEYLAASGRKNVWKSIRPLWTRHDRAGKPGLPLTSHGFVFNLKKYAAEAGLDGFHLHQTRHTFARIFAEESGSLLETQEALDHANLATTRAYVQRIGVKKDKASGVIRRRMQ